MFKENDLITAEVHCNSYHKINLFKKKIHLFLFFRKL